MNNDTVDFDKAYGITIGQNADDVFGIGDIFTTYFDPFNTHICVIGI